MQDPFAAFKVTRDKNITLSTKALLEKMSPTLHRFLKLYDQFQNHEFYSYLSSCIHALYLATVSSNQYSSGGIKTCYEYYCDAWNYLSKAINSPDYLQLLSEKTNEILRSLHAL